jgi:hypothetical protein
VVRFLEEAEERQANVADALRAVLRHVRVLHDGLGGVLVGVLVLLAPVMEAPVGLGGIQQLLKIPQEGTLVFRLSSAFTLF